MSDPVVDLRSDTVTRPTAAMRAAMAAAEVGDDVYGDDPTVNELESMAAARFGMEAALFAPSGTQTNLLALLSHCQRGDEYIVGQTAHTYRYEAGGSAVLGGIQPQPIEVAPDGTLPLDLVAAAVKPDDSHFAITRLLSLENTNAGRVLPLDYLASARATATHHGLALHLDGARVFNAAIALGVDVTAITRHVDTLSCCLSKGLGAPVGSVLAGRAPLIARARRWRKMLGGGMRQAGILAAAGIYALQHHVERLADDHANAARLGEGLGTTGVSKHPPFIATNMVFISIEPEQVAPLVAFLAERHIVITGGSTLRLVTHLDVNAEGIDRVVAAISEFGRAWRS